MKSEISSPSHLIHPASHYIHNVGHTVLFHESENKTERKKLRAENEIEEKKTSS